MDAHVGSVLDTLRPWPVEFEQGTGSATARVGGREQTNPAVWLVALAVGLGVWAETAGPAWVRELMAGPNLATGCGWAALAAALFATVVMHEAGHAVAALSLDFEMVGGSFGPFSLKRAEGRWRFSIDLRRWCTASVAAVPRTPEQWRGRMLAVVAAGPIATLLTGVAAFLLARQFLAGGWVHQFLASAAELSAFLFVLGLIPTSTEARTQNDARFVCWLVRNGEEAHGMRLYHRMRQLQLAGLRPRDYPESLIWLLAEYRGRADVRSAAAVTIADWARDTGQEDLAAAWARQGRRLQRENSAGVKRKLLVHSPGV